VPRLSEYLFFVTTTTAMWSCKCIPTRCELSAPWSHRQGACPVIEKLPGLWAFGFQSHFVHWSCKDICISCLADMVRILLERTKTKFQIKEDRD
jgi:hypothetical protein